MTDDLDKPQANSFYTGTRYKSSSHEPVKSETQHNDQHSPEWVPP